MYAALAIVLQNAIVWFGSSAVQTYLRKAAALAVLPIIFLAVEQKILAPIVWPVFPPAMQFLGWVFGFDLCFPIVMTYAVYTFVLRAWIRALTS